jgi:Uma2 family endonuclease
MMTVATAIWTIDRYHQALEAGIFSDLDLELLEGELVIMAPEGVPHASSNDEAAEYLREVLGDRARVRDAKPITLFDSEPQPDLAIVQPTPNVYRLHHPYPEDIFWVVEYSNATLAKDLTQKATIYAAAGIQEYWVADLKHTELRVFRDPTPTGYTTQLTLTSGAIAPLAFPTIQVDVRRMLG